jgi:hypothetical protein
VRLSTSTCMYSISPCILIFQSIANFGVYTVLAGDNNPHVLACYKRHNIKLDRRQDILLKDDKLKGTVSRDFLLQVFFFFMNHLHLIPRKYFNIRVIMNLVSTTPVVHLELRISPRIFKKKFQTALMVRGLGETD